MSNVITRRDFLVRQMKKEFPNRDVKDISRAVWELELEYPDTNWDQLVYFDSGKPVKKKKKQNNNRQGNRKKPHGGFGQAKNIRPFRNPVDG